MCDGIAKAEIPVSGYAYRILFYVLKAVWLRNGRNHLLVCVYLNACTMVASNMLNERFGFVHTQRRMKKKATNE